MDNEIVQENTEKVNKIILSAILIAFVLLSAVLVISALNFGNVQTGQTISGNQADTLPINNQSQSLSLAYINDIVCDINNVTDQSANIIPSSNYTINNCNITYNP